MIIKQPRLQIVRPADPSGRIAPHDLDAEAATLSSCMLLRSALERCIAILKPHYFFSDANGRIFEACCELLARGEPVDIVTVSSWLRDRGKLASVGGMAYVAQLADATPAVSNVEAHARIVVRKFQMRQLIGMCQKIAAEGYGEFADFAEHDDFMLGVERSIFEITRANRTEHAMTLREALLFGLGELHASIDNTAEKMAGISTGLRALDDLTAGLYPNEVVLVGAVTSGGKTALATQIGVNVADAIDRDAKHENMTADEVAKKRFDDPWFDRQGVVMFSLEMPAKQYAIRIASSEARVDLFKLRKKLGSADDLAQKMSALYGAKNTLDAMPMIIDDSTELSMTALRGKIESHAVALARRGARLRLVVVDYFQLLDFEDQKGSNKEQQLNQLMRGLKKFASTMPGVSFLVLVQLNDDGKVRDCTAAEMHADGFWTIEIDEKSSDAKPRFDGDVRGPSPKWAKITSSKQRNGPKKASCGLWWFPWCTRFEDDAGAA